MIKRDGHTFIRIKLRYIRNSQCIRDGKIYTNMKAYSMESAEEFGEDVSKVVISPGTRWLFTFGKARLLKEDRLDNFFAGYTTNIYPRKKHPFFSAKKI